MMTQRSIGTLCLLAMMAIGAVQDCRAEDAQEIKIGTLHAKLRFDIEQFQVKPGASVRLTFSNTDEMQHNLLILAPSRDDSNVMKVAQNAWALGPDAVKMQFVPDGPEVLFHTRVLDPQQSDTINFVAPQKEGDYPYVCTLPGHAFSMKGMMRVSKADGPVLVAAKPAKEDAGSSLHVHVMDEPKVIRAFVEGGPPRSISVGLPGGINYLFDADQSYVRFGWFGMFLDVGPNVLSRGGGWCQILGEKFELGDSGFPISIGARDRKQTVKFAGYRMRGKDVPQFFFTIDGNRVTQTVRPAPAGLGLQSEFEFERDPGPVFFYVSPHGLDLSSSAGSWHSGRLELAAGEGKKFSVTIVREQKGKTKTKTPPVDP